MKTQNKFNCFIPAIFEKAVDEYGKETGNYKFKALASDETKDSQGETLVPLGFDTDEFLSSGLINWNHKAKDNPKAIIGHPTKAEVTKNNEFLVEGVLYGESKLAKDVIEVAEMLQKSSGGARHLGLSIEGIPLKRDLINPKKILKARITGLAVTHVPINKNTVFQLVKGEQQEDYIEYEFEKADENGSITPEFLVDITDKNKGVRVTMDKDLTIKIEKCMTTSSSSGKAIRKESLEKKPKNLFEFSKSEEEAVITIAEGYKIGLVSEDVKNGIVERINKKLNKN